jgi:hypothetical protein
MTGTWKNKERYREKEEGLLENQCEQGEEGAAKRIYGP